LDLAHAQFGMWFIGKLINESGNDFKNGMKELLGPEL
jgi:hypothetical protein